MHAKKGSMCELTLTPPVVSSPSPLLSAWWDATSTHVTTTALMGSPRHPRGRLCWCDRPPAVEEPDWSPGGRTPFPHRRWCPGRPAEQRSSRNRPACCPDTRILQLASPEQQSHWCWSTRERNRRKFKHYNTMLFRLVNDVNMTLCFIWIMS